MSLRYKFHHLFFGGKINKKRLYQILEDLDSANGGESTDISALETVVGDSSSGLVKDVTDIKTAIGTSTSGSETGFYKDIVDINTAIGDESTEGTILARIKALEDAE